MNYFRLLFFSLLVAGSMASCQTEKDKAFTQIKRSEQILINDSLRMKDSVAYVLFDQYNLFAEKYPKDKNTPEFLFKAAELANALGMTKKAIELFQDIPKTYPDFNKAAECLFLSGFIYENQLGDLNKAKQAYLSFLDTYPKHPLAKDAAFSLKNLGRSPEELQKEFESKNNPR